MEDADVLIIGAGLFGTIIGDWLRRGGRNVTIVDAERPHAGSGPAACIMKSSWLTSMSKREQDASMMVLDKLYGVQELKAKVNFGAQVKVYWVPPRDILKPGRYTTARVSAIGMDREGPLWKKGIEGPGWAETYRAKTIIVAAGVWSGQLCSVPNLTGTKGVAFTWNVSNFSGPGDALPPGLPPPAIRVWAPYKQLLSVQRAPDELWVGDGTAVKPDSMDLDRVNACLKRCSEFVGLPASEAKHHLGIRPTIKGLKAPAHIEQVLPNIWVATGGAKNGTAGAGWAAYKLGEALL